MAVRSPPPCGKRSNDVSSVCAYVRGVCACVRQAGMFLAAACACSAWLSASETGNPVPADGTTSVSLSDHVALDPATGTKASRSAGICWAEPVPPRLVFNASPNQQSSPRAMAFRRARLLASAGLTQRPLVASEWGDDRVLGVWRCAAPVTSADGTGVSLSDHVALDGGEYRHSCEQLYHGPANGK